MYKNEEFVGHRCLLDGERKIVVPIAELLSVISTSMTGEGGRLK